MLLSVPRVQRRSHMRISNHLPPLANGILPLSRQQTSASCSHVYTQNNNAVGLAMPNHSLLWVLQNQRLRQCSQQKAHTFRGHTPLPRVVTEKHLLSHCCLGLRPHPGTPGYSIINAQGRVSLVFIVFRENQSQDAGPGAMVTEVSTLVDGAPVGTQDLDLKDPGGARPAVFLPVALEGGVSGNSVWQGIPR